MRYLMLRLGVMLVGLMAVPGALAVQYGEDDRVGEWVRVRAGAVTGWALADTLAFDDPLWRNQLPTLPRNHLYDPAFSELDDMPGPIPAWVGWCSDFSSPILYAEPFRDSERLRLLGDGEAVEVIGNARVNGTGSRYVLVRDLESGAEGWVRFICLDRLQNGYRNPVASLGFRNQSLAQIEFTRYDRAPDSVESLPGMVG
ncbi:MAG: hypothetical protein ACLFTK_11035 [Anaerolineales bacterium]